MSEPNESGQGQPSNTPLERPTSFVADALFLTSAAPAVQEPAPAAPAAPVAQDPPPAPVTNDPLVPQNAGLTDNPAVPAVETQPPVAPVVPESTPEQKPEEAESELNFSFDLPDINPSTVDTLAPSTIDVELKGLAKIDDNSPPWVEEAFSRVSNDPDMSREDKEAIIQLPPRQWDNAKRWNKRSKIIGSFVNTETPIDEAYKLLHGQSEARTAELENYIIGKVTGNDEDLVRYAQTNPEGYKKLMLGLATVSPETSKAILESRGYRVEKIDSSPIGEEIVDKLKAEHENDFNLIEGTEVERVLRDLVAKDAAREKVLKELQQQGQPETPATVLDSGDQPKPEYIAGLQSINTSWKNDYTKSLEQAGIKPVTQEEFKANPQAGLMKNLAFSIAVNGLGTELPSWTDHMFSWAEKTDNKDFKSIESEVSRLLDSGKYNEATSLSRGAAPEVYKFGQLRSQVPIVKSLLQLAKAFEAKVSTPPQGQQQQQQIPAVPVQQPNGQPNGNNNGKPDFSIADKFITEIPKHLQNQ